MSVFITICKTLEPGRNVKAYTEHENEQKDGFKHIQHNYQLEEAEELHSIHVLLHCIPQTLSSVVYS